MQQQQPQASQQQHQQQQQAASPGGPASQAYASLLRKLTSSDNPFEEVLVAEHAWSVKDIGKNSISGILNDLSTQEKSSFLALAAPKTLRGMDTLPAIPPTPIRKVRASEFDPYLRSLADVIDKYQLNRALGLAATEGIPQLGISTDSLDLASVGMPEYTDLTARVLGSGSPSHSSAPGLAFGSKGISKMQRTRMLSANAPALASVPPVFLDKDFDLTNPHTFSAVIEYMDITGTSVADTATPNRLLQDKLTHYLDTIEVHLLKEISRRSSSFFAALSNLQGLHSETEECVAKIQSLRRTLAGVSHKTAMNGLDVIRLKRRRGNVGILYGAVKLLIDVKQTQPMIQILLGQADYVGALDLIEDTSLVLRGMDHNEMAGSATATSPSKSPMPGAASGLSASRSKSGMLSPDGAGSTANNLGGMADSDEDAPKTETIMDGITLTRSHSIVPRNLDLRGVRSLVNLSGQLSELSRTVAVIMENEFSSALQADMRETTSVMLAESNILAPDFNPSALAGAGASAFAAASTPSRKSTIGSSGMAANQSQGTLSKAPIHGRIRNIIQSSYQFPASSATLAGSTIQAIPPAILSEEERLRTKLTPLVLGLLRMDKLGAALQNYRDGLLKEVKAMTKKHYPQVGSAPEETPSGSPEEAARIKRDSQAALAKQLRSMPFDAFYSLLVKVYVTSLVILQRSAIVHELIVGIVNDAKDRGIVIGINSVSKIAVETTVQPHPPTLKEMSARRKLLDDDDEFGSISELPDVSSTDFLSRSKTRGDFGSEGGSAAGQGHGPSAGGQGLNKSSTALGGAASEAGLDHGVSSTFGQMSTESSDVLFAAADLAHTRCAKLINVRSEQNAQLNPTDFYRLFGATWEFVVASESLCGRMCFGLKSGLLSQAKAYIAHFHDEKSKQIAVLVENEQWVQADIPIDFQHITEQLQLKPKPATPGGGGKARSSSSSMDKAFGASDDGDRLGQADEDDADDDDHDDDEMDLTSTAKEMAEDMRRTQSAERLALAPKTLKYLVVDGNKYYVVGSVLMFLKTLTDYMRCAESLAVLTTDVLNRINELLKLFNSRTCQVILGAGAMRSAGLKNITARHIALASQSLGIVIAMIPYLKTGFAALLPPKQQVLLGDFDRILRDYRDHQSELFMKLVGIMNDRLVLHAGKLVAIAWDHPDPKEFSADEGVTVHMAVLVKETTTLHKVLSKYLPPASLRSVMGEVFRTYVKRLEEDLRRIELYSSAGKNRLLMDVQYFVQQFSGLDGVDGPGSHLEVVVNNIKIKDRRAASATPLSGARGPLTGSSGGGLTPGGVSGSGAAGQGQQGQSLSPGQQQQQPQTTQQQQTQQQQPTAAKPTSQFAYNFGKMLRSQNDASGSGSSGNP
ncbi:hypothetical protein BC831DRAFT_464348 [Entophlyctis helioformis]|nr:hypothetical protein BC831DRAFT_464348 [Entophlyctis helioformis]